MITMMALDASTELCSVSLKVGNEQKSLHYQEPKAHSEKLIPAIDYLLKEFDIPMSSIDAIAFGKGPGAFTGLRICTSIVQGLAFSLDKPIIPISSLDALAYQAYREKFWTHETLIACIDARMSELYWASYEFKSSEKIHAKKEHLTSVEEFIQTKISLENNQVFVGSGIKHCKLDKNQLGYSDLYPRADEVLLLGEKKWLDGETFEAIDAQPTYLREQITWQKRQRLR